jgi:hypothetical protein
LLLLLWHDQSGMCHKLTCQYSAFSLAEGPRDGDVVDAASSIFPSFTISFHGFLNRSPDLSMG